MIDNAAGLRQLVLPAGAQPGTPRIVMGPDIPPELVTWGAAGGHGVVFFAVEIFYYDATQYVFHAIGSFSGNTCYFEGTYDPTNTVYITKRDVLGGISPGSVDIRIGSSTLNPFQATYQFQKIAVLVNSDASLAVNQAPFSIDGVSAARGLVGHNQDSAPSGAVGNVESTIMFINANVVTGRAYKVSVFGRLSFSATTTSAILLLRANGVAGTLYAAFDRYGPVTNAANPVPISEFAYMVATTTGVVVISLSLWGVGAGTVSMQVPGANRWGCIVEDVGAATDYPGYPAFI